MPAPIATPPRFSLITGPLSRGADDIVVENGPHGIRQVAELAGWLTKEQRQEILRLLNSPNTLGE